ncbi:MAG: hypothetical protein JWO60_2588 [Frankiales bacterium]|nr:hypothetical protein [Frankiales bacterium]
MPNAAVPQRSVADANVLVVLTGLLMTVIVFQGAMAGAFVRDDKERDARSSYIDAHAWGAHVGTVLALATAVFVIWRLRQERALVVAAVSLSGAFLVESYMGGLIRDEDRQALTVVHVPLAMVITGVTAWLALQAVHRGRTQDEPVLTATRPR